MKTSKAFALRFMKLALKTVQANGGVITESYEQDFEYRGGTMKIMIHRFELNTPRYGKLKGTIYNDWVHLQIDNIVNFEADYPQKCTFQGECNGHNGKWNVMSFGDNLDLTIELLESRLKLIISVPAQAFDSALAQPFEYRISDHWFRLVSTPAHVSVQRRNVFGDWLEIDTVSYATANALVAAKAAVELSSKAA